MMGYALAAVLGYCFGILLEYFVERRMRDSAAKRDATKSVPEEKPQ